MGQVLHGSATTTEAIRRTIQHSQASLRALARRAGPPPTRMMPQWRMGDRVRWQEKAGLFHRDLGDGNAEVTIANRAYRVRIGDLRPG
jgi:hypothetical protein